MAEMDNQHQMDTTDNISPKGKADPQSAAELFSGLRALPNKVSASHWLPYICIFLYPIVVLQVKAGGGAVLALMLFSGIYVLVKEKVEFSIKPILPLYGCMVLFWLVDFVTAGLAEREPIAGMLSSFTQVHFLLFPLFVLILGKLKYRWNVYMSGVVVSLLVCVVVSIYQLYSTRWGRAHGGINAILFANIVLLQMVQIALFALFNEKKWYWLIVGLGIIPLFLSQTRGVIFALLPLCVLLVIYSRGLSKGWWKSRTFIISLGVVLISGYIFFDRVSVRVEQAYDQLHSYIDGSNEQTSIGYRLAMYQGGIELASDNLWLGVGRENVSAMLATTSVKDGELDRLQTFTHLHNEYLTTLVGSGLLGLISLLMLLGVPCISIRKHTRSPLLQGLVILPCALFAIYGLTNLAFDNGTLNGVFVLSMAMVFASRHSTDPRLSLPGNSPGKFG